MKKSNKHTQNSTSEVFNIDLAPIAMCSDMSANVPSNVLFIAGCKKSGTVAQLYIDKVPIEPENFSYDPLDKVISWQGLFGGGSLTVKTSCDKVMGQIGNTIRTVQVTGTLKAIFTCQVAKGAGVEPEGSGHITSILWNPSSDAWKNAQWSTHPRLKLEYQFYKKKGPFSPAGFGFKFSDLLTGNSWKKRVGTSAVNLKPVGNKMEWWIDFNPMTPPNEDPGSVPTDQPTSVFPTFLNASEDAASQNISGGYSYNDSSQQAVYCGFKGTQSQQNIAGYFSTGDGKSPFAVFDGTLYCGGMPIQNSYVHGSTLHWTNLNEEHQEKTGLAESGEYIFNKSGDAAKSEGNALRVRRLTSTATIAALKSNGDAFPEIADKLQSHEAVVDDTTLHINGLNEMTPFTGTVTGHGSNTVTTYVDTVSKNVRSDLTKIMQSFIPSSLWSTLFPGSNPPELTGELATVAATPVTGVSNPSEWYQSLATAVMTKGMAGGTDSNCANMNGPRAQKWLKEEVAASAVYRAHSALLFNYEWQQLNPATANYLQDQEQNASSYDSQITAEKDYLIAQIQDTTNLDSSDQTKLINIAKAGAHYASSNKLYWAYRYYCYWVSEAELINFQIEIGSGADNTYVSRILQKNASILTALDPSGFYAKKYMQTINTYLVTSVLPLMVDAGSKKAVNYTLVKQYLEQLVSKNLQSTDNQIKAAAQQLQSLVQDEQFPTILADSITAIAAFSGATQKLMALPLVTEKYTSWFKTNYPRFAAAGEMFSGVLMTGITSLLIVNLVRSYASWSKLTAGEKASIVTATVGIGSQALASMAKFGVRAYSLWGEGGMTMAQKAAALLKVTSTDDSDAITTAMSKIGSNFAKWIGGTSSEASTLADATRTLAETNGTTVFAEMSMTEVVFGRNLCEFIGQRLGPALILAGIGYSIYLIAEDSPNKLDLAANWLGLISGALFLFSFGVSGLATVGVMTADTAAAFSSAAGAIGVIAALAGAGIMIYEMFQTPPDPVKTFVDNYVRPAGLYVDAKCNAIDYTNIVYKQQQPSNTSLLVVGTTIGLSGNVMTCNSNNSLSMSAPDNLADSVLSINTNGDGLSTIAAVIDGAEPDEPVVLFLSHMSDGSVSFQPEASAAQSTQVSNVESTTPTVSTQMWLADVIGTATTANSTNNNKELASLTSNLQPVPAVHSKFKPANASGYLAYSQNAFSIQPNAPTTPFTLTMAGRIPQWVTLRSFALTSDMALTGIAHNPSYPVQASRPATFSLSPAFASPGIGAFLTFDTDTGAIKEQVDVTPTLTAKTDFTETITNALGSATAKFSVTVTASS